MTLDRRSLLAAAAVAPLAPAARAAAPPDVVALWPGDPPGLLDPTLAERVVDRSRDPRRPDRARDRIRRPRLEVFAAPRPNGAAVLVIPGGGYQRVVVDKEGHEVARWLAARGITAFVLVYRLPAEGWRDGHNAPLADAQRAMRLIRAGSRRWRIDPARVAAMGFSAGGHLCADLATRFQRSVYVPVDAADALDARPHLAAPIYPVVSMDPAIAHPGSRERLIGTDPTDSFTTEHSPDLQVTPRTPPTFLVHAEDDAVVPVANSLAMRAALRAAGVPAETHLFERGGHGFGWGARTEGLPVHGWLDLWLAWAHRHGLAPAS